MNYENTIEDFMNDASSITASEMTTEILEGCLAGEVDKDSRLALFAATFEFFSFLEVDKLPSEILAAEHFLLCKEVFENRKFRKLTEHKILREIYSEKLGLNQTLSNQPSYIKKHLIRCLVESSKTDEAINQIFSESKIKPLIINEEVEKTLNLYEFSKRNKAIKIYSIVEHSYTNNNPFLIERLIFKSYPHIHKLFKKPTKLSEKIEEMIDIEVLPSVSDARIALQLIYFLSLQKSQPDLNYGTYAKLHTFYFIGIKSSHSSKISGNAFYDFSREIGKKDVDNVIGKFFEKKFREVNEFFKLQKKDGWSISFMDILSSIEEHMINHLRDTEDSPSNTLEAQNERLEYVQSLPVRNEERDIAMDYLALTVVKIILREHDISQNILDVEYTEDKIDEIKAAITSVYTYVSAKIDMSNEPPITSYFVFAAIIDLLANELVKSRNKELTESDIYTKEVQEKTIKNYQLELKELNEANQKLRVALDKKIDSEKQLKNKTEEYRSSMNKHKKEAVFQLSEKNKKESLRVRLEEKIVIKDLEIQTLQKELERLNKRLSEAPESTNSNPKRDLEELQGLLEKEPIVIVGGHVNWVAKLKERLGESQKDIIFIDVNKRKDISKILKERDNIFLVSTYANHGYFEAIHNHKTANTKVFYLNNITNINSTIKELLKALLEG